MPSLTLDTVDAVFVLRHKSTCELLLELPLVLLELPLALELLLAFGVALSLALLLGLALLLLLELLLPKFKPLMFPLKLV